MIKTGMVMMVLSESTYAFLANTVLFTHLLYVSFVIFGEAVILVGRICKWQWIRNMTFRIVHLAAISIVGILDILNRPCPLTVWENQLREKAGQLANWEMTFVEKLIRNLVFPGLPAWFFNVIYLLMACVVILTFILIPPKRKKPPV